MDAIEIGTIFINTYYTGISYRTSNADAFQVIDVTPKTVVIQQIEMELQGSICRPTPNAFKGAAARKKITKGWSNIRSAMAAGICFSYGGFAETHAEGTHYSLADVRG